MTTNGVPRNTEEWLRQVERDIRILQRHRHADPVNTGVDPTPQIALDTAALPVEPISDDGSQQVDSPAYERPEEPGSPRQPSPPLADVRLGVVTLTWDGLAAGGVTMSTDVQLVRVHREQQRADDVVTDPAIDTPTPANESFIPTPVNYVGRVLYPGPGSVVMPDQPYNTTWYYRLVAVDYDGNESTPSDATAVLTVPLVDTDIIGQVLDGAHFMDGTINTAALADGSVSGEKIAAASIDPSKLNFVIAPGSAGGNFSFYAPDPPTQRPDATALGEGDLWFDVDDNFRIHRWTAGAWLDVKDVTVEDGAVTANAIAAGAVIAGKLAAGAVTAGTIDAQAVTAGTIAANAVGANEIAANAIVAGKIAVNAVTAANIAALAISSDKIAANAITAAKIAVGAVAAGKISTGELAAGVVIYAGASNSTHAEVTFDGIAAYVADLIDGIPNLSVRLGSAINGDVFGIAGPSGFVATISDQGYISGTGLSIDTDPSIEGTPLVGLQGNSLPDIVDFLNDPPTYGRDYEVDPVGIIEQYGKGNVAWAQFGSNTDFSTVSVVAGEEAALFELGFDMEPGRQYEFKTSNILLETTGGGTCGLVARYTTDGTSPSLSSGVFARDFIRIPNAGQESAQISGRLINGGVFSQTQVRVLISITAGSAMAGSVEVAQVGQPIYAAIEDKGPVKTITGTVRTYKTGGTTGGGATVKRTYTKTYSATASGTYKGDGTKRSDTTDVVQGYNSFNGDGEGLWVFPSMTADLSGATVNKVQVYMYANHWYYNSGGTALIKVHGLSAVPSTDAAMTTAVSKASWPKPGGLWVTLPSSLYNGFKTGTWKGIGVGPAGSTNLLYYGRFNGGAGSALIRVTYTK